MQKKDRFKKLRLFTALMCIFTATFSIVYSGLERNYRADAEKSDNYSDTLYMALRSENAGSVLSFAEGNDSEKDIVTEDIKANAEPQSTESGGQSGDSVPGAEQVYSTEPQDALSEIMTVKLLMKDTGETVEMPLDEYVAAAVAAEMPTSAEPEALKAQAVACRTLAINLILQGDKSAHGGADICSSPAHCQAFARQEEYIEKYGNAGAEIFRKARNAANATKGIILLYNSQPIVAAFHASSGEYTASSAEVWGGQLDYLVSVKTNEGENDKLRSKVYDSVSFSRSDFIERLTNAGCSGLMQYSDSPFHEWVSGISRTPSGRVDFIEIGGNTVSGKLVKNALGLKSSDFSLSYTDDTVTFITEGYGHGVGMSQLGAMTMASEGASFYEILGYYYPRVSFGIAGEYNCNFGFAEIYS